MVQFNDDFHFSHATLSADRRLFNTLFGITRQDYCSLFPDVYDYNDELCWELLEESGQITGWIATIPTAEEIAANSGHSFNDCQPRYPWRHVDECPVEVEPYPMCLKLLRKAGSAVLVTPGLLPYCGGLDRYGGFVPSTPIELLPGGDDDEFCRSIESKSSRSRLAVGYALNNEGVWQPHCWLIRDDGTLLEPTELRESYYGVLLNKKAGARFVRCYSTADNERRYLPEWK